MTTPDGGLAPVRRGRGRASEAAPDPVPEWDDADLARGQAAAVLGALGRMQLRLDVLAREQADGFARLTALLEDLQARLDVDGRGRGAP
jgi:hypothetical protein